MAVIKVQEDWRGLSLDAEATLDGPQGRLPRRFIVDFDAADNAAKRPIMALTASHGGVTVPDWWDPHPDADDYIVRQKSVVPAGGPFSWQVTVIYEYTEHPLSLPYSVQFIPQGSQEAIDKDNDDNELTNSAKEPFDPPVQEEFYDFGVIIRRNESGFSPSVAAPYLNAVNIDNFQFVARNGTTYTFDPGTALCKSISAEEQRHGAVWYFEVTYEFLIRADGWSRRILDQGFREIVNGAYRQIVDDEGNPLTQPVKLDGNGAALAPDAEPVFLLFDTKPQMAFSVFNFVER